MVTFILSISLLILALLIFLILKEIIHIKNQLDFIIKNDTQMRITTNFNIKPIDLLKKSINSYLDTYHKKESYYIVNEKNLQDTIIGLSHDIRTPLTSLDGYLQLMDKTEDIKEKDKYMKIMRNRIESLNSILDQLFTFVKIQSEDYKIELEEVDLSEIILQTLFSYYEDFKFLNIEPKINIEENNYKIYSNKEVLERIFQNIYKNILKHGKSPVTISLKKENNKIIFESKNMIDENVKISEKDIFKQFYKASNSRSGSSTGLGLSISKGLIEKLGGKINVEIKKQFFTLIVEI